jgi:DNA mismatch repair protein MSH6
VQGNLSVSTMRLLKVVLPAGCLWTSLRECEGFGYEQTLEEVKMLYPGGDGDAEMMDDDGEEGGLGASVPQPIREMVGSKTAIEALGGMIWCVTQVVLWCVRRF